MSPDTRQRFQSELIHLLALSDIAREKYLQENESWKSPLGLFRETPEAISDLAELGLEPPCSSAEIRQAYRRKARATHPDQGGDQRAFIRLQNAYRRALAYCL
ncbi:MAG: J domain-containing protein [Candidatus Sericytochromatia bacterium]|nr:J domain-containing protein [Candidatus Sericytochromatia bacterium]